MVSSVRPRPNHYETLGLTPTAASDEIARAFARETSVLRPHAFGGIAEACIAYEILRDPIKRRAYDASIGLTPRPEPRPFSSGPATEPTAFHALSPYPVQRSTIDATPPTVPKAEPVPRPAVPAEQAPSSLTTILARQPVDRTDRETAPVPALKPETELRQETEARPTFIRSGGDLSPHFALEEHLGVEASPVDWKRTGMVAGGLAVATCLLGAVAGWWSAGDIANPQQPENAVSVPLPPAKPRAIAEVQQPDPASYVAAAARPDRPGRTSVKATRVDRTPDLPQLAAAERLPQDSQPQESLPAEGAPDTSAVAQGDALAPLEPVAAASLPLPNKVIARTIERIGYSCGSVASTSPVEGGAPGVYKVTCASGQSYQAKPVNGRYRFRRWGRQ